MKYDRVFRAVTGKFLILEAVFLALQINRAPGRERYLLAAFVFIFFVLGLYRVRSSRKG